MATTFTVSGLGFAKLNTTTVHVTSISYTPNLGVEPFRSGGDIAPSMIRRTGSRPVFRLTMPLDDAWTALGALGPVKLTAAEMYAATFDTTTPTAYRVGTGANKWSITAVTGLAWGIISRVYPAGGGLPMMLADVLVYFATTDGLTDPVTNASASLPTAPAAPVLHVLSTLTDDGTNRWGLTNWSIDFGCAMEPVQSDGLFYPTTYRFPSIDARVNIDHKDIAAIYTSLTGDGKIASTSFILYARKYNASTQLLDTTGYSFTFAKAFASLDNMTLAGTDVPRVGMTLSIYNTPGTLTIPCTVSAAATIPT